MITIEDALAAYRLLPSLPAVQAPLSEALHRVLRTPLIAQWDLPRHSQSAMDGYALTARDAAGAPCTLELTDAVAAGDTRALTALKEGEACRILTGARIPPDTASVVMQERTRIDGNRIHIETAVEPGANIRWQGEECRAGQTLASPGLRLNASNVAAAINAGHASLMVTRAPRIAVLVSGDEVKPAGAPLQPGQIWDSNGPLVQGWLTERGYSAAVSHLPDDAEETARRLEVALASHDIVITTGGVSVGDRDYILPAAESLGVQRVFWRVAQKPAKPLYFGVRERTALLGLPGNPASVLVSLIVHLRTLLDSLEAHASPGPHWRRAVLTETCPADGRRDRLVRMRTVDLHDGRTGLAMLPHQDSHMLSNLLDADAIAWLPARANAYSAGEVVRWTPITG